MKIERFARLLVLVIAIGLPALVVAARSAGGGPLELRGVMADDGGWTPGTITAQVGQPIDLRLTSDDVVHGFAIGQSDLPAVAVLPGKWTTTTLIFDRPGKYTFYCTRWCGPNHWRMRGTIEVAASLQKAAPSDMPGMVGHATVKPIDFTHAQNMLGANSAILQGKIVRGGMGTGMPYWGSIFTGAQTWALVDYLWTFQFE